MSAHAVDAESRIARELARLREIERFVERETGAPAEGMRVLDLGAGQLLLHAAFFARHNEVTAIDRDVIVVGFDPAGYWRMLRANGLKRTVKTAGRKALGFDRRYRSTLARAAGAARLPRVKAREMDASALAFESGSFDLAYSMLVLPHLGEPRASLEEIARVIRPGGLAYFLFTNYTSPSGALDIRAVAGRSALPPWAHLRPEFRDAVHANAYQNKLRLPEWQTLFDAVMPGAELSLAPPASAGLLDEAERLRASGELSDYSRDELVTSDVTVVWRKPV